MVRVWKLGVIQGRRRRRRKRESTTKTTRYDRVSRRENGSPRWLLWTSWMNNRFEFTLCWNNTMPGIRSLPEITPPRNQSFNINLMIHDRIEGSVSVRRSLRGRGSSGYGRIFGRNTSRRWVRVTIHILMGDQDEILEKLVRKHFPTGLSYRNQICLDRDAIRERCLSTL